MSRLTHIFHNDAHEARFTMRVVGDGDRYGRGMALTHSGSDPLVEFYDRRWDHDRDPDGVMLGQFVSRYRLSTLLEPGRDGKTVFETGITLDDGNAWRVGPGGMADCLRALREADIVPDPEAEREARVEALTELIDAHAAEAVEQAETSETAGDAYAHLPREGGWAYNNGDRRLAGWLLRTGVDRGGLGIEELAEIVLDHFRMMPGTILDPTAQDEDLFLIDSYPVGEVAIPLEKGRIAPEADPEEWLDALHQTEAHVIGETGYISSDRVWYAVIDRGTLESRIVELSAEPDPTL
jgi:hypothetical protein